MQYVNLGNTGLEVSRICLGTMTYGTSQWRDWVLDEEESRPFFRRAIDAGINFFDTANAYSAGVSEEVTGRALRDYARREEIVLATKVYFPYNDKPNQGGLSRLHILRAVEDSLRRLGTDYIDLYQIHRWDYTTPIEETLEALTRPGKIRQGTLHRRFEHVRLAVRQVAVPGGPARLDSASSRCRTTTTWCTGKRSVR